MKRILSITALLLASTAIASAADMARRPYATPMPVAAPIFNWTGFYVGVNGGYAMADNSLSGFSGTSRLEGGFAGGQIGYNWQGWGNFVVGIEADGQWSDISRTDTVTGGGATVSLNQRLENFGTVRGRLGYAINNVLLYGTGGYARGTGTGTISAAIPGFAVSTSSSNTLSGYAAGAGIEWAFHPNVTAKFEYLHLGFDSQNYFGAIPITTDVDTFKVGINYLFH